VSISRHLAHRPERSSPSAARPVTVHRRPSSSTPAVGWSCRMSHQPGSPSAQPFITSVTRLGPSWKYPNTTLLWVTERPPPVVVSRRVPQLFGFARHRPTRPPVTPYRPRCMYRAERTNQRGGSRGFSRARGDRTSCFSPASCVEASPVSPVTERIPPCTSAIRGRSGSTRPAESDDRPPADQGVRRRRRWISALTDAGIILASLT